MDHPVFNIEDEIHGVHFDHFNLMAVPKHCIQGSLSAFSYGLNLLTHLRRLIRTGEVYSALKSTRAFLNFETLSSAHTRWNLFQPLLIAADGVLLGADIGPLGAGERDLLKRLHRTGHLHIYEELGRSFYTFHTPLHLLYYQDQALNATVERVVRDDGQGKYRDPFKYLEDLILFSTWRICC